MTERRFIAMGGRASGKHVLLMRRLRIERMLAAMVEFQGAAEKAGRFGHVIELRVHDVADVECKLHPQPEGPRKSRGKGKTVPPWRR